MCISLYLLIYQHAIQKVSFLCIVDVRSCLYVVIFSSSVCVPPQLREDRTCLGCSGIMQFHDRLIMISTLYLCLNQVTRKGISSSFHLLLIGIISFWLAGVDIDSGEETRLVAGRGAAGTWTPAVGAPGVSGWRLEVRCGSGVAGDEGRDWEWDWGTNVSEADVEYGVTLLFLLLRNKILEG